MPILKMQHSAAEFFRPGIDTPFSPSPGLEHSFAAKPESGECGSRTASPKAQASSEVSMPFSLPPDTSSLQPPQTEYAHNYTPEASLYLQNRPEAYPRVQIGPVLAQGTHHSPDPARNLPMPLTTQVAHLPPCPYMFSRVQIGPVLAQKPAIPQQGTSIAASSTYQQPETMLASKFGPLAFPVQPALQAENPADFLEMARFPLKGKQLHLPLPEGAYLFSQPPGHSRMRGNICIPVPGVVTVVEMFELSQHPRQSIDSHRLLSSIYSRHLQYKQSSSQFRLTLNIVGLCWTSNGVLDPDSFEQYCSLYSILYPVATPRRGHTDQVASFLRSANMTPTPGESFVLLAPAHGRVVFCGSPMQPEFLPLLEHAYRTDMNGLPVRLLS